MHNKDKLRLFNNYNKNNYNIIMNHLCLEL